VITDAKWTGATRGDWLHNRYNPAADDYSAKAVGRCVEQARLYLMLNAALKGKGVRLLVSGIEGRSHLEALMRRHFPNSVGTGVLRVEHVPKP
jgi:hypothetical protein